MSARLIIRADASSQGGLGHVMRTLALAESASARGLDVLYATSSLGADLVVERGFGAVAADDGDWLRQCGRDDIVVFDGYEIDENLVGETAARVRAVGVVDDLGIGSWPADVVLNQSMLHAPGYDLHPETVLLLGPSHALIRNEFHPHRRARAPSSGVHALVTMGGSDVADLTEPVAGALAALPVTQRVTALVGPASRVPQGSAFRVVRAPTRAADVMGACDVAVTAAGSTTWELLFMGIPCLPVVVADNQVPVQRSIEGLDLGPTLRADEALSALPTTFVGLVGDAARLSERGLDAIDGGGRDRFLAALLSR